MEIQVDSREKAKAIQKILSEFNSRNVKYYTSKLFVGDYMSLDNARLCVDRKQNLTEICTNIGIKHATFKTELMRAQTNGIKLIILCEHGKNIKSIDDVRTWKNPRQQLYEKELFSLYNMPNGCNISDEIAELKSHGAKIKRPPFNGKEVAQIMETMTERYGVEWLFCTKNETGGRIIELLGGD